MQDFTDNFYEEGFLDGPYEHSQKTFLRICNGRIASVLREPRDGYGPVEITNPRTKNTRTVYIREVSSITGWLIGLRSKVYETDSGTFAQIEFTFLGPSGRQAVISVSPRSGFVGRFAKVAENIDLSRPFKVAVSPDYSKPGAYKVFFEQDGATVRQKYTKENPQGLPEWKRNSLTGEYDDRDYWQFLHGILANVVIPAAEANARRLALGELVPQKQVAARAAQAAPTLTNTEEEVAEAIKANPPMEEPPAVKESMNQAEVNRLLHKLYGPSEEEQEQKKVAEPALPEDYDDDIPF